MTLQGRTAIIIFNTFSSLFELSVFSVMKLPYWRILLLVFQGCIACLPVVFWYHDNSVVKGMMVKPGLPNRIDADICSVIMALKKQTFSKLKVFV